MRSLPEVEYIEKDGVVYGAGFKHLWYLDRMDQLSSELDNSYNSLDGDGRGVDVYVMDTGIRYQHQEFEYRAKYAGYDPVDEYEYQQRANYVPRRGADCNGHGTHVASLIGGKTYGTARKSNLYSVRVLRCDGSTVWSTVIDGLDFLANVIPKQSQNAIVVLPFSGSMSRAITTTIAYLYSLDVLIVGAAGNNGLNTCERSPSNSNHVITVGSTDRNDNVAPSSNYGPCIDLFAPGQNITAANSECDSCSSVMSGSTQATGLTAGVLASYFSQFPHLTPEQIKHKLISQSVKGVLNFNAIPTGFRSTTSNVLLNLGMLIKQYGTKKKNIYIYMQVCSNECILV